MGKLQKAVKEIHKSDEGTSKNAERGEISPLSRLLVTFFYILLVVSFPKYNLAGLSGMVLYLLVTGIWEEISVKEAFSRIWPVLLLAGMVGIANPFVEREAALKVGGVAITYGMISMCTLMLKGIFSVTASYFLLMTTGIEGICSSLRELHVPKELVTILLLIYRYLILLLKEAERMMQAYKLRAPGQKGIHFKAWGPFVGGLLLRSMERGQRVYESMLLRGYRGEIAGRGFTGSRRKSVLYVLAWFVILLILRVMPVFQMAGQLLF